MSYKILFVDDEQNILDSFRAILGRRYEVHLALGPEEALRVIKSARTFQVVITDYNMPVMNGVQLLSQIKEISPKTIRIMLTGHADVDVSITAVNSGQVFRFLTKPCPTDLMIGAIEAALEQYRLLMAEKDLLRKTLLGSIKVLTEILSLVNPEAFGRSERLRRAVVWIARELKLKNTLKLELSAMLSQIGCLNVPEEILSKKYSGQKLNFDEQQIFDTNIPVAVALIGNIPRLEEVAQIIASLSNDKDCNDDASIGGRLLQLTISYDDLLQSGLNRNDAATELSKSVSLYGAELLLALERFVKVEEGYQLRSLLLDQLAPGMVLAQDVRTHEGGLMMAKGLELSVFILERLSAIIKTRRISEPVEVFMISDSNGKSNV